MCVPLCLSLLTFTYFLFFVMAQKYFSEGGWRDRSKVKSTFWSSRGPEFCSSTHAWQLPTAVTVAAGDLLPQSSQSTSPHFKYFLKLFFTKTNLGKDKEKGNSKQGCRLSVQSEHNTKGSSKTSNYNQVKITSMSKRHMNFTLSGTLFTLAKAWNLPKCLLVNVSSKYQNIYSQ